MDYKDQFDKGLNSAKSFFAKTLDQIKENNSVSLLKYEISKRNKEIRKEISKLGNSVFSISLCQNLPSSTTRFTVCIRSQSSA